MAKRPRFTTRQQSSGYTRSVTYFVYDTVQKGRVTVHAALARRSAQCDADRLNAAELVLDHADDPRPYEVRRAEAEAAYAAARGIPA